MSVHDFPALAGLVSILPHEGWKAERRDHFMRVFEAVLDYSIPVLEAKEPAEERQAEAAAS